MTDDLLSLVRQDLILPMVIIAVAFVAIITATKRALKAVGKLSCLDAKGMEAFMELGQPVLGGVLGLIPGVFPADVPVGMALLLGIVSGFLSPQIYRHGLRTFAPKMALGTAERIRERVQGRDDEGEG